MNIAEIWRRGNSHYPKEKLQSPEPKWGIVESATIVHVPPDRFEEMSPYAVGLIRTNVGIQTAQLTDVDFRDGQIYDSNGNKIDIGSVLEPVIRIARRNGNRGIVEYVRKFRPKI